MSEEGVPITCPKCHSTHWRCWDERSFDCWNEAGYLVGVKVVGYLACKDCGESWTDVSIDPCKDVDDSWCEEDQ